MDGFETPYEVEDSYIQCEICNKSIRGDSLYKIHVTTPSHLKKEDALIAQGAANRQQLVPEFKDILHYLDYLNLDEPIIGLDYLVEIPTDLTEMGSNYYCNLCSMSGHLDKIVYHLIGRKHRQSYMIANRPDLVTWINEPSAAKAGKIIRAKAEMIERQDGRGTPKPLCNTREETKSIKEPTRQNRGPVIPQRQGKGVPALLRESKQNQSRKRGPTDYLNAPVFNSDKPKMNRGRQRQLEDMFRHGGTQDDHQREAYETSKRYRYDSVASDLHNRYENQYCEEPRGRSLPEAGDVSRFDHREDVQHDAAQHIDHYSEDKPHYQRSYPKREELNEFYQGDGDRSSVRSLKYQPLHPEDDAQRRSLKTPERMYREKEKSIEPEADRRTLPEPVDDDHAHNHFFGVVRDYKHGSSGLHQTKQFDDTGSSRLEKSSLHRQGQVSQTFANIPEPFKRFLASDINENKIKRRKSRFSDASPGEVGVNKDMLNISYGQNPNYVEHSRRVDAPSEPQMQYSESYRESESTRHHTRSPSREGSRPNRVTELLENIEIENAEEATFLKTKLCNLLREFKAKKQQKEPTSSRQPDMPRNYGRPMPEPQLPQRHQYDRPVREDGPQPNDLYSRESHRSSLMHREDILEDRFQENPHSSQIGVRLSHRSHYEEMFGQPSGNLLEDPPYHHEGFQEPLHPRDYLPPVMERFDGPLHMEQEPSMHSTPRYSNSLEKISSTLLELVSRK